MTDIYLKIDRAKEIAVEHASCAKAAKQAIKNRDAALYKLLENVHEIDMQLRDMGKRKAKDVLRAKYGNTPPKNPNDFLKLIYSELRPKTRSKYVAVLAYAQTKDPDQPLKKFVRTNGSTRGCIEKEKKLRDAKKSRKGG
ncbi:MAG: hypothetical protein WAV78_48010 [Xanthobacteraceae bacterium]